MALLRNRIRGCIVGGALGDAIGLFTEFMDRLQCQAQYGINPKFKLVPPTPTGFQRMLMDQHRASFEEGSWTDDTDQSLLILMSFLHDGGKTAGIDHLDFAARLRHWFQFGFRPMGTLATDVGRTVGAVVNDPIFLKDPFTASTKVWESGGRNMAANGAVMRTAVVGALFYKDINVVHSTAMNLARTTHADPRCLVSCTIASALVAAIVRDEVHSEQDVRSVVDTAISPVTACDPPLQASQVEELQAILWKNSLAEMMLDQPSSIGYTYKCIATGIWALRQGLAAVNENDSNIENNTLPPVFERIITELTMAGGDSDTNCAVAGSLLGTLFGYLNLPPQWLKDLRHRDWLLSKADAATYLITGEGVPYAPNRDPDNLVDGGKGPMSKVELKARWASFSQSCDRRTRKYWEENEELPQYS